MLSDNHIHPTTYGVSKINNVTPLGVTKITLKQDHYNAEKDNVELKICDYYSSILPVPEPEEPSTFEVKYNGISPKITIGGSKRIVSVSDPLPGESYTWKVYLDGQELDVSQTQIVWTVSGDTTKVQVGAAYDFALIGKVIKIEATQLSNGAKAYTQLEVVA